MEKRIELEKRARKPNQITDLNLDNCRSTSIVGLTDEYTALESLSLINVGLTTLKGFPKLPNLKKLELSDNRISNGLDNLITSPKLQYLNLSGNKIKDFKTLKPLQEFKNLVVLDLFNNEATHVENYREKIFEMLPSLKFLDGFDCNDVEAPSDGDDGSITMDSEEDDDDSDCSDEDNGEVSLSDDDDNGDVSLSEVYNDDIEDDNSEWDEDGVGDDDDDEDLDDDDDVEEDANAAVSVAKKNNIESSAPEESQARGKKRKHDG